MYFQSSETFWIFSYLASFCIKAQVKISCTSSQRFRLSLNNPKNLNQRKKRRASFSSKRKKMKIQKTKRLICLCQLLILKATGWGPSGSEQCRAIANKVNFKLDEGCCLRWTKSIFWAWAKLKCWAQMSLTLLKLPSSLIQSLVYGKLELNLTFARVRQLLEPW